MPGQPAKVTPDVQHASGAMNAAGEQIALALRDSQGAVDALAESLERLGNLLQGTLHSSTGDVAAVRGEMLRAVVGLQFYDRLTQHLTHVRDYLALAARQCTAADGERLAEWTAIHRELSSRLLSETQRMYLGEHFSSDTIAHDGTRSREERGASSPGDIDLF